MTKDRLVYSSDLGRVCPECARPAAECICKQLASKKVIGDGRVKLRIEKKGRGGKTVSIISGLPLDQARMQALLSDLKRQCGAGGTIKDGEIELQGEHRETLRKELFKLGYNPKG